VTGLQSTLKRSFACTGSEYQGWGAALFRKASHLEAHPRKGRKE